MTDFVTPTEERRAAVYLVHHLHNDRTGMASILEDGPVSLTAVVNVLVAVCPTLWTDDGFQRIERHAAMLAASEHGLLDGNDG